VNLHIDRERFLLLVSAIGAVGCTQGDRESSARASGLSASTEAAPPTPGAPPASQARGGPAPQGLSQVPAVTPGRGGGVRSSTSAATPVGAEDTPTVACGAQNDEGAVDCSDFKKGKLTGPACEGISGTCDLLAGGKTYRPRAARAAAACMSRVGARACEIGVRKRCYEEGVRATCPEAQFASVCQAKIDQCKAAGQRVTYTKEECMKAASALTGGERAWALNGMGPSSEGVCRLTFTVL
jgi:hypothetical protein